MPSWIVNVNEGDEVIRPEDGLFDVQVTDTFNPFSNYGIAKIDDFDGSKFDLFERGTRVDFEYQDGIGTTQDLTVNNTETSTINNDETESYSKATVGGTWTVGGTATVGQRSVNKRLQGFVVERREIENNGSDQLEIEVYSLDQLLRGGKVSQSTVGLSISEALEQIIVNDTPVRWDPNLVAVEDDFTLRRDFQGDKVDNAILTLSFYSANERIRVNSDLTFEFFRQEQTEAPRDIAKDEWFYADVPEDGKEVINECRVFYNDGESLVTVETGADKLALQDALGLDDPYSDVKEISRPDITDLDDAKREGNKILDELAETTPITVTTFGLESAEPGEVLNVTIPEKGVDDDFEIASISYDWSNDETDLILIENTGYQDDLLTRVNDRLDRIEIQDVNRGTAENRITDTRVGIDVTQSVTLSGSTFSDTRVTNTARNKIRDAWGGATPLDITEIAIGSDGSNLKRTNTSLENETERVSVTESLNGGKAVDYTGVFTATSASEVGLFDSSGDMVIRAVGNATDGTGISASATLTVADNSNIERGVFTDSGQTAVRDIIADNSPQQTTQYAYGRDGTTPNETDTSLGNESITVSLGSVLVQEADTTSEFDEILATDDRLVKVENGEITTAQTAVFGEAEDFNLNQFVTISDSSFSGGSGIESFTTDVDSASFSFVWPDYDLPAEEVRIVVRLSDGGTTGDGVDVELNGTFIDTITATSRSTQWVELQDYVGSNETVYADNGGSAFEAGETQTLTLTSNGTDDVDFDCVAIYDNRESYDPTNWDNTVDANNALEDPRLHPDLVELSYTTAETERTVTEAEFNSTWNDTSNNQYVELANDESTFTRFDNSSTGSVTFASANRSVDVNIGISNYASDSTTTPSQGDSGQAIQDWNLFANPSAINPFDLGIAEVEGVVPSGNITGDTIREAGQKADDGTLLSRSILAAFDALSDTEIRSSEKVVFDRE